jgi:HTH-type transcriptional regulator / antitoxin HipB
MNPHTLLGRIVRGERKAKRLSQQELGEFSGTGLNFISQLERGKQTLRFDKLISVLDVLGLELNVRRGKKKISADKELVR